jgi:hypothetical protein
MCLPAAALGLSRSELERQRLCVCVRERERARACVYPPPRSACPAANLSASICVCERERARALNLPSLGLAQGDPLLLIPMLPSAWERKIRSGNETRGEGHWHLLGESPCEARRRLSCVQFELSKTELVLYRNGHQFVDSHKNLFSGFVGGRWRKWLSSGFECKHWKPAVLPSTQPASGSLHFCHPPSLRKALPCSRESHAAASPRSRGRGITFRPCRKKHLSALARTQARQPLGGRRAQGSRATAWPSAAAVWFVDSCFFTRQR